MSFDIVSQEKTKESLVDDLNGDDLKDEVRNQVKQLEDLVFNEQFSERGALFVVEGSWGAGKSTVTWALINLLESKLKERGSSPVFIFKNQSSLLPFGSSSESIRVFLTGLAQELWEDGLFDVRKDIQQSILEVAPPNDGKYNVSTHLGPVNISKDFGGSSFLFRNSERIKTKFRQLADKNGLVILVLDDIDRLRPSEIVSLLRLAEQLRQIPRVLTIVPVYRPVADNAFEKDLQLVPADAATFMRKFTDFELRVENNFDDLARCFKDCFITKLYEDDKLPGGVSFQDLCWDLLLFNLVTQEAIQEINGNKGSTIGEIFSPLRSKFLTDLKDTVINSQNSPNNPYAVFNDQDLFIRLAQKPPFQDLATQAYPQTVNALEQLINNDNVLLERICIDETITSSFIDQVSVAYDQQKMDKKHQKLVSQLILPLLTGTHEEQYLTNNYRMRDVKKLAHSMQRSRFYQGSQDDPVLTIHRAARDAFRKFRF